MSDKTPAIGAIGWLDLSIPDATRVRDFYAAVCGWTHEGLSMGDYEDYVMKASDGSAVGGVCHARGSNANVPPHWIPYAVVSDIDASVAKITELGGTIVDGPRSAGGGRMVIFRDPAGAHFGLWQG